MTHASIRSRFTATYIIGVVMAVLLTMGGFHALFYFFGLSIRITSSRPTTPAYRFHSYLSLSIIAAVAAVIVALFFGYLLARGINRRIDALANGARYIAAGDLSMRVPVQGRDELAQLGATFNDMSGKLQDSLAQRKKLEVARRDLVANVAHDLRTPLAAIRAAAEALEDGVVEDKATSVRYLAAIRRETLHLSRLIEDLFALSQLEAGQLDLKPDPIDLEDIIQDSLAGLLPRIEQGGVRLAVDLSPVIPAVLADRQATRRVLTNILQNALTFSPADGVIAVRGMTAAEEIRVEVNNTGSVIPAADLEIGPNGLPRIFERFYRGDPARGGAGLGLAIAGELIRAQGGRVWARSSEEEGTTVGFSLPVYQNMQG